MSSRPTRKKIRALPDGNPHWGDWIMRRAEFIGLRRRADLARAIGISAEQLAELLKLETVPTPDQLDRRKQIALVRALQSNDRAIFGGYGFREPSDPEMGMDNGSRSFVSYFRDQIAAANNEIHDPSLLSLLEYIAKRISKDGERSKFCASLRIAVADEEQRKSDAQRATADQLGEGVLAGLSRRATRVIVRRTAFDEIDAAKLTPAIVAGFSFLDLIGMRGCGDRTAREIRRWLKVRGLDLKRAELPALRRRASKPASRGGENRDPRRLDHILFPSRRRSARQWSVQWQRHG